MPEQLTKQEIDSKTDPSVAKQWDTESSTADKFEDFYKTVDGMKIGLLATYRNGVGVSRPIETKSSFPVPY